MAEAQKSGYYGEPIEEAGFGFEEVATVKKSTKSQPIKEQATIKSEKPVLDDSTKASERVVKSQENNSQPSGNQISWGVVLRKLRANKEIMLWVACQDVSVSQEGDVVMVCAPGENEYSLLSKPENVKKLLSYVIDEGAKDVKIIRDKSEVLEQTAKDEQTEAVKALFEGENLNIEE